MKIENFMTETNTEIYNPDNVYFILVEPQTPGNVGSAARAIKTMGFRNLWLINPCDHLSIDARKLAHGAEEILEQARIFENLSDALADMHFSIATTNRLREYRMPAFTPEEAAQRVAQIAPQHKVAVVFGREQSGLTNEELRCCHAISTVPAAVTHPSLNLAQAVMIYAYAFFSAKPDRLPIYDWEPATQVEIESVYTHLEETMKRLNFVPRDNWDRFVMRFKRLFGRAYPEKRDVRLMHKIFQAVDQYIEYGGSPENKPPED
jgi:TrmH family RNA methyltransferase